MKGKEGRGIRKRKKERMVERKGRKTNKKKKKERMVARKRRKKNKEKKEGKHI